MIEIEHNKKTKKLNLILNGVNLEKVNIIRHLIPITDEIDNLEKTSEFYEYIVNDRETSEILVKLSIKSFPNLWALKFDNWFSTLDIHNYFLIEPYFQKNAISSLDSRGITGNGDIFHGQLDMIFAIVPSLDNWKEEFNFAEFCKEFLLNYQHPQQYFSNVDNTNLEFNRGNEFGIFYNLELFLKEVNSKTILEEIEVYENNFRECYLQTYKNLKSRIQNNSILTSFNFPYGLKIACEQYLLYFANFLRDLGINAESNLKEEAGKVLFSVTPTDDVEALDKIREALALYLNLPSSPIIYDDSFASMRLQQQIENLQHSQKMAEREIRTGERELRLSQTVIENQDKIINQKDSIIEQQNKIIERITDKSVMINSAENKEELEDIFEGIKVGKSENLVKWLGLHLNPATAIKSVGKKITGKGNEIINLDLDKVE